MSDARLKAILARVERGGGDKYHAKNTREGKLFARERIAHYWENQMWTAGRQYIRMQRLALPLARDGRNVDMVFACHVRVDATSDEAEAARALGAHGG